MYVKERNQIFATSTKQLATDTQAQTHTQTAMATDMPSHARAWFFE
jgi:hypothetical protein